MARRRKALDDDAISILRNFKNPTFYQYGSLREADTLCIWNRERTAVVPPRAPERRRGAQLRALKVDPPGRFSL
jgi:hypothetical protein